MTDVLSVQYGFKANNTNCDMSVIELFVTVASYVDKFDKSDFTRD